MDTKGTVQVREYERDQTTLKKTYPSKSYATANNDRTIPFSVSWLRSKDLKAQLESLKGASNYFNVYQRVSFDHFIPVALSTATRDMLYKYCQDMKLPVTDKSTRTEYVQAILNNFVSLFPQCTTEESGWKESMPKLKELIDNARSARRESRNTSKSPATQSVAEKLPDPDLVLQDSQETSNGV